MKILVHVGFAKTGTSFLQDRVFADQNKGYFSLWGHDGVATELFVLTHDEDFDPASVRSRFERDTTSAPEALVRVVSHEGLSGNAHHDWRATHHVPERIRAVFPEARVLICIREQKSLIYALYNQDIRNGRSISMDSFIAHRPEGYRSHCRFENYKYHRIVEKYFEAVGREKVLVVPFESFTADPRRFEETIHRFAGSGAALMDRYPRDNPSIGPIGLEIIRRFNHVIQRPDGADRRRGAGRAHRLMVSAASRIDRLAPKRVNRSREAAMKALIAERLEGYYAASNRRLAELTGLPLGDFGYQM